MTDIAIRNVKILDGSGSPAFEGDVGIEGDRISAIGKVGVAKTEIDGKGAHLSPGFVDTHAHDDGVYSPFGGVSEVARALRAATDAGAPASYQVVLRDALMSVSGLDARYIGQAEAPLRQLSPAVLDALGKDDAGRRALQSILQAPPRCAFGVSRTFSQCSG